MTSVNGFDGNTNNYLFNRLQGSKTVKGNANVEKTATNKPVANVENTFDYGIGTKQVSDVNRGLEVEMKKLDPADAKDLQNLYALAGLKNVSVPTQTVYNRIGNSVAEVGKTIADTETENHAEQLFDSQGFNVLNNIFFA